MTSPSEDDAARRRCELADRLAQAQERIADAVAASGRHDLVDLVVVTKTFPASDVALLAELGVRAVGENRDQEAKAKREQLIDDPIAAGLRWHMIGRLQSNKAASVAAWADVVESVDRVALVPRLASGARRSRPADDPLGVLIQVSLDEPHAPEGGASGGTNARGGANPADVPALARAVAEADPVLRLDGVMGVAPHPDSGVSPDHAFARLADVLALIQEDWPQATVMSAGMSGDLEAAVRAGATQVRIGGAILGPRPAVQ